MEIVFCERCGVSIPEHQVVGSRQATGGRDLCATCSGPGQSTGDLELYFCENCRVSIPVPDVLTGQARADGSGYLCAICSHAAPAERSARRLAVERELEETAEGRPHSPVPAPLPAPAGTPALYFCDICNASISAHNVATGRAAVQGGRTVCPDCRVRTESFGARGNTGFGVVPALAASLVGAAAALGGLLAWQRHEAEQARPAVLPEVALEQRLVALRDGDRAEADRRRDAALEREARLAAELGSLRSEIANLREQATGAAEDGARVVALLAADRPGEPDRLARLESRMEGIEGEMREQVRVLGESMESRMVKALEAMRDDLRASGVSNPDERETITVAGGEEPPLPPREMAPGVAQNLELLRNTDAGVRFSAAIELGKLGDPDAVDGLVAALAGDDDVFVRRACARSLGELKAYVAFPALVEALSDAEEYVAKQAALVIAEMAEQDFGYKQSQSKGDRKRVADRARKWWEDNKARLQAPAAPAE